MNAETKANGQCGSPDFKSVGNWATFKPKKDAVNDSGSYKGGISVFSKMRA